MTSDSQNSRGQAAEAAKPAARLFAVRLQKEELDGGSGYRGSARDVITGAYRGFRDWADLIAFMVAQIEQDESARGERAKEVRDVSR